MSRDDERELLQSFIGDLNSNDHGRSFLQQTHWVIESKNSKPIIKLTFNKGAFDLLTKEAAVVFIDLDYINYFGEDFPHLRIFTKMPFQIKSDVVGFEFLLNELSIAWKNSAFIEVGLEPDTDDNYSIYLKSCRLFTGDKLHNMELPFYIILMLRFYNYTFEQLASIVAHRSLI